MHYPFHLPALPYTYDALEPYIDFQTIYFHHDKHFNHYIDKLNHIIIRYPFLQDKSLKWLLENPDYLPAGDKEDILKNAGGVYNHNQYFNNLTNKKEETIPIGNLLYMINRDFGSFEKFKEIFSKKAEEVFGSGYLYLVMNEYGYLGIMNCINQDTPLLHKLYPLLTLDLWEHAYYLKYKNLRQDYIKNFWQIVKFPIL